MMFSWNRKKDYLDKEDFPNVYFQLLEGFIHPGVEFLHDIGTRFVHVFQVAFFEVDYVVEELWREDQIAESPEGFVRSHE